MYIFIKGDSNLKVERSEAKSITITQLDSNRIICLDISALLIIGPIIGEILSLRELGLEC